MPSRVSSSARPARNQRRSRRSRLPPPGSSTEGTKKLGNKPARVSSGGIRVFIFDLFEFHERYEALVYCKYILQKNFAIYRIKSCLIQNKLMNWLTKPTWMHSRTRSDSSCSDCCERKDHPRRRSLRRESANRVVRPVITSESSSGGVSSKRIRTGGIDAIVGGKHPHSSRTTAQAPSQTGRRPGTSSMQYGDWHCGGRRCCSSGTSGMRTVGVSNGRM